MEISDFATVNAFNEQWFFPPSFISFTTLSYWSVQTCAGASTGCCRAIALYLAPVSNRQFSYLGDSCECVIQTDVVHVTVTDNTAIIKSTHVSPPPPLGKKLGFRIFQTLQKCPFYAAVWCVRSKWLLNSSHKKLTLAINLFFKVLHFPHPHWQWVFLDEILVWFLSAISYRS